MAEAIRITTGAETAMLDVPKDFKQRQGVLTFARKFLSLEVAVESETWCGTRPCLPVIGPASKHDNL